MNKESFNKYNKAITAKRDELTVYVQQQFGSINFNNNFRKYFFTNLYI